MTTALDRIAPVAVPDRIGQGTSVEQSRAIAQVQAMVIVAQQCPRSVPAAIRAMEEACRQIELAEQAFFRFPRAGEAVEGPSVHLARELARCWGNIEYGVTELRRDDDAAQSEMLAFAWDLQTNTRSSAIFIAPHKRDTRQGVKTLTDMRDIYENNANNGARRVREAIFTVLPVWYRARAEKLCRETIENGGGVPLAQRIADAVKAFERYRVPPARLAAKFGYARADELRAPDVAQLGVIYGSLQQGTVTVEDEFPAEPDRINAEDLAPAQEAKPAPRRRPAAKAGAGAAPPADAEASAAPASPGLVGVIQGHLERLGVTERDGKLRVISRLVRRQVASSRELTAAEGRKVADTLEGLAESTDLAGLLDDIALADDPRGEDGQAGA